MGGNNPMIVLFIKEINNPLTASFHYYINRANENQLLEYKLKNATINLGIIFAIMHIKKCYCLLTKS
jgi:hypothetical protein